MSLTSFHRNVLPEASVYQILSNSRRRRALAVLAGTTGSISVRELADAIADSEAGKSPAPASLRNSVYVSLRQTHLPYLAEYGIVAFDPDCNQVRPLDRVRELDLYQDVVTRYGISWVEIYRYLGLCSLLVVLGALADAPLIGTLDALLVTTLALGGFALLSTVQLWRDRRHYLRWVGR